MQAFEDRIAAWAAQEENIRAVVVTGSRSRDDGSMDEWSDLDVQLITTDHTAYAPSSDWLENIGSVWVCLPLTTDIGFPTRLVWFAGGNKVDFSFWPVDWLMTMIEHGELADEYQRGYYAIVDKDGLVAKLPPSPHSFPAKSKPSEEQFRFVVDEFWFEAIHVAQFIRRRELWVVKFRDSTMKSDLLQIMEWHAQAEHDWQYNTWLIGKRIAKWTDSKTW